VLDACIKGCSPNQEIAAMTRPKLAYGLILRSVGLAYIWVSARQELDRTRPDARITNLETSVTRNEDY
jgi:hypothetical protein